MSRRNSRRKTDLEKAHEMARKAFDLLPPLNVARTVEETMEKHGAEAAGHAWQMAMFAHAHGQEDIAQDYEHVYDTIIERQKSL